jgi:hypothetical protein
VSFVVKRETKGLALPAHEWSGTFVVFNASPHTDIIVMAKALNEALLRAKGPYRR